MTILEGLSGSQKRVWEHLQEDEQEKAAWAFDSLDESAQKELVGHMDGFDREDLTQGFEQIIERQAEHVRQQQESQKQEGQSEGQSHSKGGRAISM
jgi:rubrerythrin